MPEKKGVTPQLAALTKAVEKMHGAKAIHAYTTTVHERFEGKTVWEGTVSIFALGFDIPKICYAWSVPPEPGGKERFYAVLKTDAVDTPAKAVRASIVADAHRAKRD